MLTPSFKANSRVPIIIGMLCMFVLTGDAQGPQKDQPSGENHPAKESVKLFKMHQPDSPITIESMTIVDDPDDGTPIVQVAIENTSNKPILIKVLRYETNAGKGGLAVTEIWFPTDQQHPFQFGQTRKEEFSLAQFGELPESLTISVDFVEFLDGTRWGPDTSKSGEQVDGVRAGARAERDALMKVLMTEGPEGVMRSLDSITPEADQSIPRSEKWLDGFKHGVAWVRSNVRRKGQTFSDIERELRNGFDLPGERR